MSHSTRDRVFPVAAARLWNSLPSHVTAAPLSIFCSCLKSHLFSLSYPAFGLFSLAACQLAGRWPLYFTADVSILFYPLSPSNLGRLWADRHQILPHVQWWLIYKCGPKTSKFRILRFDCEYLRTGTRYRRSENGVENCNHSPTCLPNLANFGPQTAKNRTIISTHSIDFFGGSYLSSAPTDPDTQVRQLLYVNYAYRKMVAAKMVFVRFLGGRGRHKFSGCRVATCMTYWKVVKK